ncbi:ferredoxin [Mycolicibacterium confluentis]|uniref:Ferredoxin n=1 Tax=Mycolicibacterium confluentis TaxID=28047 RepID=A0A7I7Y3Q2_9MYCO|nr:ferredoxin [Mycolicibacterium confluentis]MCV7320687.1 ferredoxin [Mycolicibacterium confluentis]ORV30327.1 ferredoxin reductase [Mycolicibacterium confluentis]BBZ35733.1 ferredoxin [Mycolicibacterium confluentis]
MRVQVDETKCSGIGMCEMTAASVFEVGDDGQAHVIKPEPDADEVEAVQEAISNCPTQALSLA